jgi:hypothetical protein
MCFFYRIIKHYNKHVVVYVNNKEEKRFQFKITIFVQRLMDAFYYRSFFTYLYFLCAHIVYFYWISFYFASYIVQSVCVCVFVLLFDFTSILWSLKYELTLSVKVKRHLICIVTHVFVMIKYHILTNVNHQLKTNV